MTKLFAAAALLPTGLAHDVSIEIENGLITSVEQGSAPAVADERHALLAPAVPNLHSHAFQRAMAGLTEKRGPDEDSFWSWRTQMYRFALSMTPDDVEAVAAQLYVEMLEAGFSRVGEFHYLHHDVDGRPYANIAEMAERIAAASAEAGIGLTLLPVFYAHSGFGPKPPIEGQRRFINDTARFAELVTASRRAVRALEGAVVGIAPHSLRAATIDEIREILPFAEGQPVHIHVAEQLLEVEDCIAATGARPVELLLAGAPVDQRWCLIHATHLTADEVAGIAATKAVAGLCPITEANLGDGIFAGAAFVAQGGRLGVGSDSNVQISLAGELRQLEYSQRLARQSRNVIARAGQSTAAELVNLAAKGGAAALGVQSGIAVGNPADLVSFSAAGAPYLSSVDQLDAFVFASGVSVADVWVGGNKQVVDGKHVKSGAIRRRFESTMHRLLGA
ncbi:N-formimino-L-glutamate deiminase [Devosia sp. Root413D1]|uniref:formimidoylglutamate deiminase n=1 Tax=Devosia sp. Root413D1 TaxID=1736531 RepID=UPI0006FE063E|nr:formimidoylglutamate deiminase [Devosia sp. Root413D1]KQW81122.1 N-formimino-L-glutamate deiminase [Devosia sp. Root413D1]